MRVVGIHHFAVFLGFTAALSLVSAMFISSRYENTKTYITEIRLFDNDESSWPNLVYNTSVVQAAVKEDLEGNFVTGELANHGAGLEGYYSRENGFLENNVTIAASKTRTVIRLTHNEMSTIDSLVALLAKAREHYFSAIETAYNKDNSGTVLNGMDFARLSAMHQIYADDFIAAMSTRKALQLPFEVSLLLAVILSTLLTGLLVWALENRQALIKFARPFFADHVDQVNYRAG